METEIENFTGNKDLEFDLKKHHNYNDWYKFDQPVKLITITLWVYVQVQPFAGILDIVGSRVPRVLFNKNAVGPFRKKCRAKDITIEGIDPVKHDSFCVACIKVYFI